ncbi:MAG: hypothetical protein JW936_10770 [Sedimentisphaerales bacterium]|nr:hypothetical protein [Sedimentisphaerales bacterium]
MQSIVLRFLVFLWLAIGIALMVLVFLSYADVIELASYQQSINLLAIAFIVPGELLYLSRRFKNDKSITKRLKPRTIKFIKLLMFTCLIAGVLACLTIFWLWIHPDAPFKSVKDCLMVVAIGSGVLGVHLVKE